VGVVSRRFEFSRFSPAACIEDAATQGTQHPFIQALHEPGCAWRRQTVVWGWVLLWQILRIGGSRLFFWRCLA
jgi:hypothetical protein